MYDQFSAFRAQMLAALVPYDKTWLCTFVDNNFYVYNPTNTYFVSEYRYQHWQLSLHGGVCQARRHERDHCFIFVPSWSCTTLY